MCTVEEKSIQISCFLIIVGHSKPYFMHQFNEGTWLLKLISLYIKFNFKINSDSIWHSLLLSRQFLKLQNLQYFDSFFFETSSSEENIQLLNILILSKHICTISCKLTTKYYCAHQNECEWSCKNFKAIIICIDTKP